METLDEIDSLRAKLAEAKACIQMGCENSGCSRERNNLKAELTLTREHLVNANRGAEVNAHINQSLAGKLNELRVENERLRKALQPFATGGHLHMTYGDYDSRTAVDEALKAEWHCPKCNGTSWARDYGKMEVRCLTCDPDPTLEFARPIAPNDQET